LFRKFDGFCQFEDDVRISLVSKKLQAFFQPITELPGEFNGALWSFLNN